MYTSVRSDNRLCRKLSKIEAMLLQNTNRKWYMAYRIGRFPVIVSGLHRSITLSQAFRVRFFAQYSHTVCSVWQYFNWDSASRGFSVEQSKRRRQVLSWCAVVIQRKAVRCYHFPATTTPEHHAAEKSIPLLHRETQELWLPDSRCPNSVEWRSKRRFDAGERISVQNTFAIVTPWAAHHSLTPHSHCAVPRAVWMPHQRCGQFFRKRDRRSCSPVAGTAARACEVGSLQLWPNNLVLQNRATLRDEDSITSVRRQKISDSVGPIGDAESCTACLPVVGNISRHVAPNFIVIHL